MIENEFRLFKESTAKQLASLVARVELLELAHSGGVPKKEAPAKHAPPSHSSATKSS